MDGKNNNLKSRNMGGKLNTIQVPQTSGSVTKLPQINVSQVIDHGRKLPAPDNDMKMAFAPTPHSPNLSLPKMRKKKSRRKVRKSAEKKAAQKKESQRMSDSFYDMYLYKHQKKNYDPMIQIRYKEQLPSERSEEENKKEKSDE